MLPPRMICRNCGTNDLEWVESSKTGVLETFTVVHVPPVGLGKEAPYIVGIIKLDNGGKVTARIEGFNPNEPEKIKIGSKVTLTPLTREGKPVLAFKPINQ